MSRRQKLVGWQGAQGQQLVYRKEAVCSGGILDAHSRLLHPLDRVHILRVVVFKVLLANGAVQ